jgi:hypothetical protein
MIYKFVATRQLVCTAYFEATSPQEASEGVRSVIDNLEYCCLDSDLEDSGFDVESSDWDWPEPEVIDELPADAEVLEFNKGGE